MGNLILTNTYILGNIMQKYVRTVVNSQITRLFVPVPLLAGLQGQAIGTIQSVLNLRTEH